MYVRKSQGCAVRTLQYFDFRAAARPRLRFAGTPREVGLPEHAIPLALAFSSIGVETGRLPFTAGFFAVVWASTRVFPFLPVIDDGKAAESTWSRTARLASPSAYVVWDLGELLVDRTERWILEPTRRFGYGATSKRGIDRRGRFVNVTGSPLSRSNRTVPASTVKTGSLRFGVL